MINSEGQGLLSEIANHWNSQGWNLNDLSSFRMEMNDPSGGTATGTTDTNQSQGSEGETSEYSIGGDFLKGVPDEHKSILEPYVKKWDAGVTRRFQDLHNQYKPYQDLGLDVEELSQAAQVYQMLQDDDQAKIIYNALHEQFGQEVADQFAQEQNQQQQNGSNSLQGLPPEFVQRIDQQQQMLESLAQIILNQQSQSAEAQEDAELDNYLNLLKEEFGDYDEDYVLAKMDAGMSGEDAVKQYQAMVQTVLNQNGSKLPILPTLSNQGGSSVPVQTQSIKDLPRKDVKELVAKVLADTHNQGS